MTLISGRSMGLWLILVTTVVCVYVVLVGQKKQYKVRTPPALGAFDEVVGRATEMGRPIHFTPGSRSLIERSALQIGAGLALMRYTANIAANKGARMICSVRYPELLPMSQDIIRSAYQSVGRGDLYSDEHSVRYLSTQQMAYASGAIGLMHREKVAGNFMLGPFTGDTLILAEGASQVGAMQIGGMAELGNIPL